MIASSSQSKMQIGLAAYENEMGNLLKGLWGKII
jgi:hypothetical protein